MTDAEVLTKAAAWMEANDLCSQHYFREGKKPLLMPGDFSRATKACIRGAALIAAGTSFSFDDAVRRNWDWGKDDEGPCAWVTNICRDKFDAASKLRQLAIRAALLQSPRGKG